MQEKEIIAEKYELVKLIGRGGMGSVWEGRHVSLGTRVAIKFIESAYASSEEARSRFDREAHAAASIRSKHAIQIFDHGVTTDGHPYIVMELLEGESLGSRLDRASKITLAETASILRQIGRALTRAHEAGIVHRDLKPENVFLVRDTESPEQTEIAKVLDFGIAKIAPGAVSAGLGATAAGTKTGVVIGTPHFMSPEQARGLRSVDHRTDVWALGTIAYRCVTGRLAFDGDAIGDLLVRVCTDEIPVPSQVQPDLPPAFDAWLARALERDVDARFATVRELCDALDAIATPSTPSVPPPSFASAPTIAPAVEPSQLATSYAPFTASVGSVPVASSISPARGIALKVAAAVVPSVVVLLAALVTMRPKHDEPPPVQATSVAPPPEASTLPAAPVTPPPATSTTIHAGDARSTPMRSPDKPEKPARRFKKPFDPRDPGY